MKREQRLEYLDSMRGIAAVMVMMGHFILWKFKDHDLGKALFFIFNANDAVSFFFVLSGFVLSYSFLQQPKKNLFLNQFYVARLFRLMPAFWLAFLVNVVYFNRYNLTFDHFATILQGSSGQFWEEFFLFKGYNNFFLPGWTLSIELCVSFFMPFLIVIGRYNRKVILPLAVASILGAYIVGIFAVHFILGVAIAAYYNEIKKVTGSEFPKWLSKRWLLWVLALVLFSSRAILNLSPLGSTMAYLLKYLSLDIFTFTAMGAALIIVLTISSKKLQQVLELPFFKFYGRISYGIYLVHWVMVTAFYDYWDVLLAYFNGNTKILMLVGAGTLIVSATIGATVVYYFLEKPFIALGRKVIKKMKPKWNITPAN